MTEYAVLIGLTAASVIFLLRYYIGHNVLLQWMDIERFWTCHDEGIPERLC